MDNLVKYNNGEIEVSISIKEDMVWLNQTQISEHSTKTSHNSKLEN